MKRRAIRIAATAAAAGAVSFAAIGSAQAKDTQKTSDETITFGWTAWSDAKFVTHLAKNLIEERTDHKVKLKMAAIGVQYKGVAGGDLDGMLMSWLPDTHENYIKKLGDQIVDLGPLYEGAKLGWVVPDYVPKSKLSSIKDLHKESVQDKLGGTIQGIDPGAGLMQLSEKAMKAYNLNDNYRLKQASGSAMTAALKRASNQEEWIVATGWTPHWMFGKWSLRFLKDPKGTLGAAQHINVQVRKGFKEDYPKAAKMLSNMHLKLETLQKYMYKARETSEEKAIDDYIANHKDKIDGWFKGDKSSS
ncbi:glycine betaine ABC transporter substrate-binding protein [Salinisphaera orenii]|uniref:glycine betaine ABC transporter substrate-binding protein n=1 Tax=Salinisphaera orenii TaxID=856731 RepID=UPI0018C883FA